jgi:hypothetical protein
MSILVGLSDQQYLHHPAVDWTNGSDDKTPERPRKIRTLVQLNRCPDVRIGYDGLRRGAKTFNKYLD